MQLYMNCIFNSSFASRRESQRMKGFLEFSFKNGSDFKKNLLRLRALLNLGIDI